ncbi:hypothetical protein ACNKHW_24410 [Shigella flexneri]
MEQAIANEGLFYRLLYLQRSLTAARRSRRYADALSPLGAQSRPGRCESAPAWDWLALRCAVEPHSSGIGA